MTRLLLLVGLALPICCTAQTLEECQAAAANNYPIVRKYALIEKSATYTLENISKGWLPQVTTSAQATWQSDVVTLPAGMTTMLSQMGTDVKGLRKDQYRIGVDVSQPIYDGGAISSQKTVARAQAEVERSQNDVDLYALCKRVNDLYFSLLLIEDRIQMNTDLLTLLRSTEKKLESMSRNGTAAESDYHSIRAERIGAEQQRIDLDAQHEACCEMLSILCGMEVTKPVKPNPIPTTTTDNQRPELALIASKLRLADAQEKALDASLRPRVSLFASGFYGYPGYDMYHDMFSHDWSFNAMVGAKVAWNISALYTRKSDKAKIGIQRMMAENSKDLFLFNNSMENAQISKNIEKYNRLRQTDAEIVALRQKVRMAAESKLDHGIIDVNDLIKEIYNENNAKSSMSMHEVEWLRQIYDLKYTNNN